MKHKQTKGEQLYMAHHFRFYRVLFRFFTLVLSLVSCLLAPIAIDNNTHQGFASAPATA